MTVPSASGRPARSAMERCAGLFATWFGVGLSPRAPGTMGALAALPLHWLLIRYGNVGVETAVVVLICCLGIIASQSVARQQANSDPQIIVVDEVAGVLIPLLVAGGSASAQLVAFLAFRGLDILKPWPIARLEHIPHAGVAVMADDIAAGLVAAGLVWAWLRIAA